VAALFDEWEHFSGKSLPLSHDIHVEGRRFEGREMFLRREYSSERQRQDSERATFHSMLLSLERVEKLITWA
jgi:hypothetical protein